MNPCYRRESGFRTILHSLHCFAEMCINHCSDEASWHFDLRASCISSAYFTPPLVPTASPSIVEKGYRTDRTFRDCPAPRGPQRQMTHFLLFGLEKIRKISQKRKLRSVTRKLENTNRAFWFPRLLIGHRWQRTLSSPLRS